MLIFVVFCSDIGTGASLPLCLCQLKAEAWSWLEAVIERELARERQKLTRDEKKKKSNFDEVNDFMSRSQDDVTSVLPN